MTRAPALLRDLLELRAGTHGDRLAFADDRGRLTFGELAAGADGLAARLHAAGVGPGDRVAVAMSSGVAWAETFWALQWLGAVPCALNPTAPAETLRRRAALARPRLLLTDESVGELPAGRGPAPEPPRDTDAVAILQPTSGTSGEPRIAMLRHRNVLRYLDGATKAFGLGEDDVLVAWVPPWHDLGLLRFVVTAVAIGAPCHIVAPAVATIPRWLGTIGEVGGTVSGAPDFAYRLGARLADPARVDLGSLRLCTNGGEPVRASTIAAFEARFGVSDVVQPGYGLAEATLGVSAHRPGERHVVDAQGNVSCGRPMPGVEVRVSEEDGGAGELLVRGESVFAGYFDAPEATQEALRDGWLHTGDVGSVDGEGRVFVLGRRRAMLKRGGAVVAPRELEEAAQGVAAVRVAAAVGVASEAAATEEIAVVVEAEAGGAAARDGIADEVARAILAAAGFAPARVLVVPPRSIPRTHNGKVRHEALRAALAERRIG